MRVLFIGDIVGKPGRQSAELFLSKAKKEGEFDLILANAENAAGGNGLTEEVANELLSMGIDALSMGNHVWDKKEIFNFIDFKTNIIRPVNYPPGTPGAGSTVLTTSRGIKVGFVNALGRVFCGSLLDCPFRRLEEEIQYVKAKADAVIVDFHAEATSEKIAMGWYLDGRISAIIGTHTHVQTADETVLPGGTAYISDVGMTGPYQSVIGVKKELVIQKFVTQLPVRFEVAKGPSQFCAVIIEIDSDTGKSNSINRLYSKN